MTEDKTYPTDPSTIWEQLGKEKYAGIIEARTHDHALTLEPLNWIHKARFSIDYLMFRGLMPCLTISQFWVLKSWKGLSETVKRTKQIEDSIWCYRHDFGKSIVFDEAITKGPFTWSKRDTNMWPSGKKNSPGSWFCLKSLGNLFDKKGHLFSVGSQFCYKI